MKKRHSIGAHLVLAEISDRICEELEETETIELPGSDRAFRVAPGFFTATRKAVHDAQR